MGHHDEERKLPAASNDAEIISLFPVGHDSHDKKWSQMTAEDSELVGSALVKAEQLRQDGVDAGDAYLQGIADALDSARRTKAAGELIRQWDIDAEATQFFKKSG